MPSRGQAHHALTVRPVQPVQRSSLSTRVMLREGFSKECAMENYLGALLVSTAPN